jgi:hypothetical protein
MLAVVLSSGENYDGQEIIFKFTFWSILLMENHDLALEIGEYVFDQCEFEP